MTTSTIIGIDCATEAKKVGLARGILAHDLLEITDVRCGGNSSNLLDTVSNWITSDARVLLALDAPLGWPFPLRGALGNHEAGMPIAEPAHRLFRRETDRIMKERWKRQPLDVGADRIARTAHSALKLLGELSTRVDQPIPLAWDHTYFGQLAAIEVYPAATLSGRAIRCSQYKEAKHREARQEIIGQLANCLSFAVGTDILLDDADVLDAVVCVVAGVDFLRGDAFQPTDQSLARSEGWIWAKLPQT